MLSHHVICSYETPCCQLTALNVCLGLQFISHPENIIVSLGCFKHKIDELNTAIRLRFTTRESTCVSPTKVDKPDFESWFPQNKTGSKMTCTICPVNILAINGLFFIPNSCWCIMEKTMDMVMVCPPYRCTWSVLPCPNRCTTKGCGPKTMILSMYMEASNHKTNVTKMVWRCIVARVDVPCPGLQTLHWAGDETPWLRGMGVQWLYCVCCKNI